MKNPVDLVKLKVVSLSKAMRVSFLFLALPLLQLVQCGGPVPVTKCEQISSCECKFNDGSGVISLTTIASTTGEPKFPFKMAKDKYLYAYNPCYSFSDHNCKDVAACQKSADGNDYFDIGDQANAAFNDGGTIITYKATQSETTRTSHVNLICDASATTPSLEVLGETSKGSGIYNFNLRSNCACTNGCMPGGLSPGSVLCILFSVGVILYLLVGILFLKFVRGAEGKELIPNFEFWKDFPILVKDGVLFLASGCKSDTNNYEQI